ncbi:unnamed protein product [Clonostachys chloroleuca]|uniref:DNA repair metallo-beta-lactamase domain-containing protein n=1 Tax=Clonostachys chloroleuca TaxID=1926264 RepID=A0AA35MEL9_9HYPO|nr:unnamed protein product [Clonostachys chloroleuca]
MVASTKSRSSNTPRKPTNGASNFFAKKQAKPNASILSFFKKTDKPEDSLFVGGNLGLAATENQPQYEDEDLYSADPKDRFNENQSPVKKRKVSSNSTSDAPSDTKTPSKNGKPRVRGPFVMDSDSEDEVDDAPPASPIHAPEKTLIEHLQDLDKAPKTEVSVLHDHHKTQPIKPVETNTPPRLKHEETSVMPPDDFGDIEHEDYGDLDMLDGFEGEELREMRFMREQARLEAEEGDGGFSAADFHDDATEDGSIIMNCPSCGGNMAGLSTDLATRHVNSCLDGNPTPLPKHEEAKPVLPQEPSPTRDVGVTDYSKRFKINRGPKPPQENPLEESPSTKGPKSAFSKLMSNNAEDSAWATAAAAEKSSRGRPAYERICPFYKIMPGFSICVDAFRYNAIEGCKAYFLSHFHSDHYIGLTARWTHGPIYCSKVTGSLVRKQLGTADKWVVELEFERKYDIPGTDGATVTMIPANHCPGSSLFLFEKKMGNGSASHVKRILHCGDFRACPDHVGHPLLKPEVKDMVSGKVRQQKIDICYLDTTYLNPRYSFPPQEDVIKACADLCASMSADPNSRDDIWDRASKEDGAQAVSKYFQKSSAGNDGAKSKPAEAPRHRLLVICGTYSIGKERICVAIAKALNSKIFASPGKIKICKQLGMPELTERLTSNPLDAQVHMQMLMEIRAETLQEYLNSYKPHFSRIVGFRPSGWNFRPGNGNGKAIGANTPPSTIPTEQVLHSKGWRTRFNAKDFTAQRGSTKEAMCFGVPYSEHSSFRELAMFVMSLRIEKIVPTVNVGSEGSRARMKAWNDRWMAERRRCGLVRPLIEGQDDDKKAVELWDGKPGKGGAAWW